MPEAAFIILLLAVLSSYFYAFVSGFTDAANVIATSVGSRALSPLAAVSLASVFQFIGALTGTAVALTIGKGLIDPSDITLLTVIAAIVGGMSWSLFCYRFGIPVSETHGLVGGVLGAGIASAGLEVVRWAGLTKVLVAIIASPVLGVLGGLVFVRIAYGLSQGGRPSLLTPLFINLQRLSAIFMAVSHGRNDAQKPMGILTMALAVYYGWTEIQVPLWVIGSCAFFAALGMFAGGWRIVKTLGVKLTRLRPIDGFSAETSAAGVLQFASALGIPVSTTHTITSTIIGVGISRRLSAVDWKVARDIVICWVLTLPATTALGGLYLLALNAVFA